MTGRIFWAVCWIGILVAMGGVAYGQAADKKPDAKPAASAPAEGTKPLRKGGPMAVIQMDQMKVEGKVQKPHVYLLLGRGELKYKGLPMDRSLLQEIENAAQGAPF